MKVKSIFIAMTALCLSACSSEDSDVDTLLEGFEDEKIDLGITNEWDGVNYENIYTQYGETTEGFYYYGVGKNTMMYISKKGEIALPLCTKVECVHGEGFEDIEAEDTGYRYKCNSTYVSNAGIQVYNGKLYADTVYSPYEEGHPLLCCELDGTDKKEVLTNIYARVDEQEDAGKNVTMYAADWTIVDEKIYIVTEIHIGSGAAVVEKVYVDVYDLASGELIQELFCQDYNVLDVIPSYLYVGTDNVYIAMYMSVANKGDTYKFIQINKSTGEYTEIDFGQDRDYKGYIFAKDKIIFGKDNGDVYTLDVYGNEVKCIELDETEKQMGMYYKVCGDYIFLTTREPVEGESGTKEYYTKIYDKDYNYIDIISHSENITVAAGGTNEILFKGRSSDIFFYINVDEVGTGNIELKSIEIQKPKTKETETESE